VRSTSTRVIKEVKSLTDVASLTYVFLLRLKRKKNHKYTVDDDDHHQID
jgi:hypothetical protein